MFKHPYTDINYFIVEICETTIILFIFFLHLKIDIKCFSCSIIEFVLIYFDLNYVYLKKILARNVG